MEKKWYKNYFTTKKTVFAKRPVQGGATGDLQLPLGALPPIQWECNEMLVRLFYASIILTAKDEFEAYVRGIRILVTLVSLSNLMGVPHDDRPASYLSIPALRPSQEVMAIAFQGEPSTWYAEELKPSTFRKKY